jgi:hypothetical protein
MKYRTEFMLDNQVIHSHTFIDAIHPHHAARLAIERFRPSSDANLYVANDAGDRWVFSVKRVGNEYDARVIRKSNIALSKDAIDMVFLGNISIKEAGTYHG